MTRSRPTRRTVPGLALGLVAGAIFASGCGQSASGRRPTLASLPLVTASRIAASVRSCDHGANAYCSLQVVVVGTGYTSSGALLAGQRRLLDQLGWSSAVGDSGKEQAADSPGHGLRLTLATAGDDLEGIDLGWIQRRPSIAHALSRTMFDRMPAISLMLETGSS